MNDASYISLQLKQDVNVDVPADVVRRVLDEKLYVVVRSPNGEDLFAGQRNAFFLARTAEEIDAFRKYCGASTSYLFSARGLTLTL